MNSKRFIAGAICPSCGALDRLVVEHGQRRCVSCGYCDPRPSAADSDQLGNGDVAAKTVRLVDEEA